MKSIKPWAFALCASDVSLNLFSALVTLEWLAYFFQILSLQRITLFRLRLVAAPHAREVACLLCSMAACIMCGTISFTVNTFVDLHSRKLPLAALAIDMIQIISRTVGLILTLANMLLFITCQVVALWDLAKAALQARDAAASAPCAQRAACVEAASRSLRMVGVFAVTSVTTILTILLFPVVVLAAVPSSEMTYWLFQIVLSCDIVANTVAAMFMSGLVGQSDDVAAQWELIGHLRRFGKASFNMTELQAQYDACRRYLDEAHIRWVRVAFLRQLVGRGRRLPRYQDLPRDAFFAGSEDIPLELAMQGRRTRYIISHPWLAKQHPDPEGHQLVELLAELDALGCEETDAVFYDYTGMPQHDLLDAACRGDQRPLPGSHRAVRTLEEDALFKTGLTGINALYSFGGFPVIVVSNVDVSLIRSSLTPTPTLYFDRGWCVCELCIAQAFDNIANPQSTAVACILADVHQGELCTVAGFHRKMDTTSFTSKGDKMTVISLFVDLMKMHDNTKRRRRSLDTALEGLTAVADSLSGQSST